MIIAAVIRQENQILIQRTSEINNQIVWELPNCEISGANNQIDSLVEKCKTLNVTIEVTDIFFEDELDNQQCVVYNTDLRSYSYSNNSGCWVDAKELRNLSFSKQFVGAINRLVHEYDIIYSINREIEKVVVEESEALGIKIEFMTSYNYSHVLVHNDYGNYCPFIFSVDYAFESEDDIRVIHSWHIKRMYADGDKTDLYVLFANIMSVLLKCTFHQNVYIDYLSLFDPLEINATSIIFNEIYKDLTVKNLKQVVEEIYSMYTFCMFLFENLVGSFSLIRDDTKFSSPYSEYFNDNKCCNCFSREEHQYYSDFEKGISLLIIDNDIYHAQNLLKTHEFKFVDGIDGKILYQKNKVKESFNYVSNEDWQRISKVITDMEIKDCTIVCQTNQLYLLEQNGIWIFEGNFSEYWATIEKEKNIRQAIF